MRTASSIKALLFSTCILSVACGVAEEEIPNADGSTESLIARAQAFELDTEYNPPPGEALHHQTAGFAKILCSGVFITGLDAADAATPLESWSMTKSLTGTLMGVLIEQGTYELWQPAPVPEWQEPGDPRQEIRIGDIMRMSSGIKINAPSDPDYDRDIYADHHYLYTATSNSYEWAATRPQEWPPNTIGRYRNTDPVLTSYLIRLGVEGRGQDYHSFPQHDLFDKIGIRDGLIETDPQGNFLGQGLAFMPARDWARLGNLYLQDGVWDGERILPEGYVEYASTLAPTWVSDGRLQYGGAFFWVNGQGSQGLPESAYSMRGAGGQSTTIIPTHDLVVVRLGKYTGSGPGGQALNQAFGLLMEAVPPIE